jgi:hypothetical protein
MKNLEMENYGVVSLSFEEVEGIDGGVLLPVPSAVKKKIKEGLVWLAEEAAKTCAINCTASWCQGFVSELFD